MYVTPIYVHHTTTKTSPHNRNDKHKIRAVQEAAKKLLLPSQYGRQDRSRRHAEESTVVRGQKRERTRLTVAGRGEADKLDALARLQLVDRLETLRVLVPRGSEQHEAVEDSERFLWEWTVGFGWWWKTQREANGRLVALQDASKGQPARENTGQPPPRRIGAVVWSEMAVPVLEVLQQVVQRRGGRWRRPRVGSDVWRDLVAQYCRDLLTDGNVRDIHKTQGLVLVGVFTVSFLTLVVFLKELFT
jgi:hypothetical protein